MAFDSINSVPGLMNNVSGIGETLGEMWNSGKEFIFGEETEGRFKIRDPEILAFPEGANYDKDNHSWIKIIESRHTSNAKKSKDSRVDDMVGQTVDQISHEIALPFPQNIQLAETYEWGSEEIGLASHLNSNASMEQITQSAVNSGLSKLKSIGSDATGLNLKGAIAVREQRIKNPRIAALFKNVNFRQFALTFDFAPTSEKEVRTVISTIRAIRANAAVSMGENADYIQFPNRFDVKIHSGEHVLINYGECVATGINVNYTPDGIWATFRSGFPVHVTMDISFMETKIVTREDILSGNR